MTEQLQIRVNGRPVSVPIGTVLAAAIASVGVGCFHRSPQGQARAPLCGMGVCMECRVTIDGRKHARSCTVLCADGMEVWTDE
jgi:predicted molibdopterin-dependent oxidoreductase YjgC